MRAFMNPYTLIQNKKCSVLKIQVTIWDDQAYGYDCGDVAAGWFSEVLGEKVRLLIKGTCPRKVGDLYLQRDGLGHINSETAFADEFPILMTSEESLKALQEELPFDVKEKWLL
ncbi:hypothetical protein L0F63_004014 [Massospora cicadina]|nr:hypothetical protein L0F63_004014 [Massospora cicadina]